MNTLTPEEHRIASERLAKAREEIRETGATVLSPTALWSALQKEVQVLVRQLKPK
jgi:hypothetical protein